jgi:DNA-binding protein H-NS
MTLPGSDERKGYERPGSIPPSAPEGFGKDCTSGYALGFSAHETTPMAKNLAQIQKQIDALQRQADEIKQKQAGEVIARIKEAIRHYGLTAADLGLVKGARKAVGAPVRKRAAKKTKAKAAAKYRDESGRTWTGRGRRPKWFVDGLAAGKKAEDFAV